MLTWSRGEVTYGRRFIVSPLSSQSLAFSDVDAPPFPRLLFFPSDTLFSVCLRRWFRARCPLFRLPFIPARQFCVHPPACIKICSLISLSGYFPFWLPGIHPPSRSLRRLTFLSSFSVPRVVSADMLVLHQTSPLASNVAARLF